MDAGLAKKTAWSETTGGCRTEGESCRAQEIISFLIIKSVVNFLLRKFYEALKIYFILSLIFSM